MMLLKMDNIEKSFGDRKLFSFPNLTIYEHDRIGLIGLNGSGKTTLLAMIADKTPADKGKIEHYGTIDYFEQFGNFQHTADQQHLKEMKVIQKTTASETSGGEKTRLRLAETFSHSNHLLLLDEPTANLDLEGIKLLKEKLKKCPAFVLISHDIQLLNEFCNQIIEIRNQKLWFYSGNYQDYQKQKELALQSQHHEYQHYQHEKKRLQAVYSQKTTKAKSLAKKPKNMSHSEYRTRNYVATSRSNEGSQKSMERAAKSIQSRLEQLEVKEKPLEIPKIKINFSLTTPPENKILIQSEHLSFSYDNNKIFDDTNFFIKNKSKVAILGRNGSGKTTLLKLIEQCYPTIYTVPKVKIGYLYQEFDNLCSHKTIIDTMLKDSIQKEHIVRSILARLLFKDNDLTKKIAVLSGGEKIKLSLAKLLVSDINVLVFDEPTNYLDVPSVEALISVIKDYEGTVIFVSHNRQLINSATTNLLLIDNRKIEMFDGNLHQYEHKDVIKKNDLLVQKTLLEMRQIQINQELLSCNEIRQEELEAEYLDIIKQLNHTSIN